MRARRTAQAKVNEWGPRCGLQYPIVLAALAVLFTAGGCSNQKAAAPGLKGWAGSYVINTATDQGNKLGGGDVIWNSNPEVANEVELKVSAFTLGGLETYDCGPDSTATPAWQGCLFVRVGTQELKRPGLTNHPLPVKPWDKNNPAKSKADIEPIAIAVLNGMVQPDTERLIGSIVKDGKVEYLVLYRLVDGISDGRVSKDLLFIDLKDPAVVAAQPFENGWGTGGKK